MVIPQTTGSLAYAAVFGEARATALALREVGPASLDFHATKRTNILGSWASSDVETEPAAIPPRHGRALVEQARGDEDGVVRTPGQLHDDLGRRHVNMRG